jgi:hypothetical protein
VDEESYQTPEEAIQGLTAFPAAVLLQNRKESKFFVGDFRSPDSALEIRNWVARQIEEEERNFVYKEVQSSDFKDRPQEFKNVLFKDHEDSIRKLSLEYRKLLRDNEKLRKIIAGKSKYFFLNKSHYGFDMHTWLSALSKKKSYIVLYFNHKSNQIRPNADSLNLISLYRDL